MTAMFPARSRCQKSNSCPARSPIICIPSARRPSAARRKTGAARCSPKARPARWAASMNRISQSRPTSRFFSQALGNGFTFGEAAWAAQPALVLADHRHRRPALPSVRKIAAAIARATFARTQSAARMVVSAARKPGTCARRALARSCQPDSKISTLTTNSAVLTEKLADLYDAQANRPRPLKLTNAR